MFLVYLVIGALQMFYYDDADADEKWNKVTTKSISPVLKTSFIVLGLCPRID